MRSILLLVLSAFFFSLHAQLKIVPSELKVSNSYNKKPETHKLNFKYQEASGICPSFYNDKCFWLHEDSGSDAVITLISHKGKRKGCVLLHGVQAFDFEDIALYRSVNKGSNSIVVGDVGDNFHFRPFLTFYLFPDFLLSGQEDTMLVKNVMYKNVEFPLDKKGKKVKRNVEAFFVDPQTDEGFLFTKAKGVSEVYSFSLENLGPKPEVLKKVTSLYIPHQYVTAADISSSGDKILLKTLKSIFYWKRKKGTSVAETLSEQPKRLNYEQEAQGEAACFSFMGRAFYTISECTNNAKPTLRKYGKKD